MNPKGASQLRMALMNGLITLQAINSLNGAARMVSDLGMQDASVRAFLESLALSLCSSCATHYGLENSQRWKDPIVALGNVVDMQSKTFLQKEDMAIYHTPARSNDPIAHQVANTPHFAAAVLIRLYQHELSPSFDLADTLVRALDEVLPPNHNVTRS